MLDRTGVGSPFWHFSALAAAFLLENLGKTPYSMGNYAFESCDEINKIVLDIMTIYIYEKFYSTAIKLIYMSNNHNA